MARVDELGGLDGDRAWWTGWRGWPELAVPSILYILEHRAILAASRRLRYTLLVLGPIAQWLERPAHNRLVAGSNPAGPTSVLGLTVRVGSLSFSAPSSNSPN
jgi:hypothetical protein